MPSKVDPVIVALLILAPSTVPVTVPPKLPVATVPKSEVISERLETCSPEVTKVWNVEVDPDLVTLPKIASSVKSICNV